MMQRGRDGWLDGALFRQHIARPAGEVWAHLLAIQRTPAWRTHLESVEWAQPGPPQVGSRIEVTTSLLWYRSVRMVCEVTRLDADAGVFAYRVIEGPATTENEYRVTSEGGGTRFEMQGRVRLDSTLIRLTAPILKLARDRMGRREVARLKELLEQA